MSFNFLLSYFGCENRILFFLFEKNAEKADSDKGTDDIGGEIVPVAIARGDEMFLDDFGAATIKDADDGGKCQGFDAIAFPVGEELVAVAPEAKEGKAGVHEDVGYFVEA